MCCLLARVERGRWNLRPFVPPFVRSSIPHSVVRRASCGCCPRALGAGGLAVSPLWFCERTAHWSAAWLSSSDQVMVQQSTSSVSGPRSHRLLDERAALPVGMRRHSSQACRCQCWLWGSVRCGLWASLGSGLWTVAATLRGDWVTGVQLRQPSRGMWRHVDLLSCGPLPTGPVGLRGSDFPTPPGPPTTPPID